jgi:hypothetical protein
MPSTAVNGEPLCIHHTTTAAQNDLSPYVSRVFHPNYPFNDTWKELARISSACQLSTVSQALNLAPCRDPRRAISAANEKSYLTTRSTTISKSKYSPVSRYRLTYATVRTCLASGFRLCWSPCQTNPWRSAGCMSPWDRGSPHLRRPLALSWRPKPNGFRFGS